MSKVRFNRLNTLSLLAETLIASIVCLNAACTAATRDATADAARAVTPASSPASVSAGDANAQREDLDVFEREFFDVDKSYSPEARAEAGKRIAELRKNAGAISDLLFVLRLSQVAALADNGHTGVLYRGPSADSGRIPLRLAPFGRDFVVVQSSSAFAELLGGRLVALGGTPIASLRSAAHTLFGGTEARRDSLSAAVIESPGQLNALGLIKSPNQASYKIEIPGGERREAALSVENDGPTADGAAVLEPATAPSGWRTLLPIDKTPWSLQEPEETMRWRDLPQANATVIQLRANFDAGRSIAAFLDEAETARRNAGRRNVILDMRMNGGGNLQLTQKWMSDLPKRLPAEGRVVILIGPWTFSAAISSTGYVKQAGGARAVLVGEPPGDRLRFWAEGRPISLPHSGAYVLMATQRHDYLTGCKGFHDCHEYMVKFPIALPNLDPEVAAPWSVEAYAAGRDPGMDAAVRVLSKSR